MTLSAAVLTVSACTSEKEKMDEHHFDNKLFINTSVTSEEILVKPSGAGVQVSRELTIGTALKAANKITGRFVAAPEMLETYKLSCYDENAVALADTMCVIDNADVIVEAGATASAPATVTFTELEKLDRETVYVMPVALRDVEGIDVLASKTVVYYVFKGAALINVVANIAENRAYPDFNNDPKFNNLTNFTMEALIRPQAFGRQISTIMGIEGNFLLRIGDAGVPDNQRADGHTVNTPTAHDDEKQAGKDVDDVLRDGHHHGEARILHSQKPAREAVEGHDGGGTPDEQAEHHGRRLCGKNSSPVCPKRTAQKDTTPNKGKLTTIII